MRKEHEEVMKNTMKKVMKSFAGKAVMGFAAIALAMFVFTITALADTEGTVTGDRVNVRAEANTTSAVLTKVTANEKVTIIEETKGSDGNTWYKIKTSGGTTGFVRSDYVKKGGAAATPTGQDQPTAKVTAVDNKTAYIKGEDGTVNIRKDATTNSSIVATAKAKSEVTVTGEATAADGYKWYQIKFSSGGTSMTGFIRSDLVTFTKPASNEKPVETNIEGNQGDDNPASETPSETPSEEVPDEKPEDNASTATLQFLEPVGEPSNIPTGYEKVDVKMGEQIYSAWAKGDYYIVYGVSGNSDAQWYVYDYKNNSFVSYAGLFADETAKKSSGFNPMILVVILGILLLVFIVATILLAIKAFGRHDNDDDEDGYDFDYDDEDDEDDGDDFEELDEDDYEVKPARTKKVILPKKEEKPEPVEEYDEEDDDEYYEEDEDDEDEEEEYVKPKKAKKEKKSFKDKILDYFTVKEEDDEEDDEEEYDEDEYDEDEYEDEDEVGSDTGDISFIDL